MTWTHGATQYSKCEGGELVPLNGLCHKCGRHSGQHCGRPLEDQRNIKIKEQKQQIENLQLHVRVLCKAIDSLVDFGTTVGGSSSYWDDVWPELDALIEKTRREVYSTQCPAAK